MAGTGESRRHAVTVSVELSNLLLCFSSLEEANSKITDDVSLPWFCADDADLLV